MSYKQNTMLFLVLLLSLFSRLAQGTCLNVLSGNCTAGCWNEGDLVLANGTRVCIATEPGYYSPAHSNERIECPFLHVSEESEAEECTLCPAGTYVHLNRHVCNECPSGTYRSLDDEFEICIWCHTDLYDGTGSTNVTEDRFCYRDSPAPSAAPSSIPTSQPSAQPSNHPSQQPSVAPSLHPSASPSSEPSFLPSQTPSASPSTAPSFLPSQEPTLVVTAPLDLDGSVCGMDEYVFHGSCSQCPSTLQTILYPVVTLVVVGSIGAYYFFSAPQGTANIFILNGYMQGLALIGTTHVQWPVTMTWIFNIGSIFALDIDVILPLQCLFNFTPQQSKLSTMTILLIAYAAGYAVIMLWSKHRGTSSDTPKQKLNGIIMVGLFVGFQTLTHTSLEAIQCSPVQYDIDGETSKVDWFCHASGTVGDKFIAYFGLFSLFLYSFVGGAALWKLLGRYKESVHTERISSATDASVPVDPESQQPQGKATTLRTQATATERNATKDTLRPFLNTYTDDKWSWSIWMVTLRFISVVFVVVTGDIPMLSQVLMICLEAAAIVATWLASPYWQDSAGDLEDDQATTSSFSFLSHQANDIVLRSISIVILVFGIVLRFIDPMADGFGGLGTIGFVILLAGIVYTFIMAYMSFKEHQEKQIEAMTAEE